MATSLSKFKTTGTRIDEFTIHDVSDVVIPTEITEIKEYAFSEYPFSGNSRHGNQVRLKSVHIPDSVVKIGAYAFASCQELMSVHLPRSLARLESYTFHDCSKLNKIEFPEGLKVIDKYALVNCGIEMITVPNSVEKIGQGAFMSCHRLRSVTILNKATVFDPGVFYKCGNITIYTTKNSTAEEYAKKNGISYKYIEDASDSTDPVASVPSCTSQDKGYTSIQLKDTGDGFEISETRYSQEEGIFTFCIDYEDGRIFVDWKDGTPQETIGYYEQKVDPTYGAKVFDQSKQRVIGRVGDELIHFRTREADPTIGRYFPDEECLAYYTKNGNITALGALPYMGFFRGSEIGGAAAFVAVFNAYNFKGVYRDYFEMDPDAFKEKHQKYLHPMGW